jgi:hypothetical protein
VLGNVGHAPALAGEAVDVDQVADAVGARLGQLHQQAAALGVPDDGDRTGAEGVHHREGVAYVGVPRVQGGLGRVAVPPLVERDRAPAAFGEQRGEQVEGSCEVEAAVHEEDGRRVDVTPLVHRELQSVRRDHPPAIGPAGVGHRRPGCARFVIELFFGDRHGEDGRQTTCRG